MKSSRGWRRLGYGIVILIGMCACFFIWARLLAGGPISFIPGGALRGEIVEDAVRDWSFTGATQYLDVESRARWLPYSRTTWFMVFEGDLFILLPRLFGTGLEDRLREDPAARIRIDQRIYSGGVIEEVDGSTLSPLLGTLIRRLMSVEVSGEARPVSSEEATSHGGIGVYRFDSLGG